MFCGARRAGPLRRTDTRTAPFGGDEAPSSAARSAPSWIVSTRASHPAVLYSWSVLRTGLGAVVGRRKMPPIASVGEELPRPAPSGTNARGVVDEEEEEEEEEDGGRVPL